MCNKLTSLNNLPSNLKKLLCYSNQVTYDFEPTLENCRKYNASAQKKLNINFLTFSL